MPAASSNRVGNTPRILPLHKECLAQFTGAWPPGFRPCWKRRPWWHLITTVLSLCGGVAASGLIVTSPPAWWLLLPWSSMLTVHAARKAQLVICHHAVHGNMMGTKRGNRILVEILSTVLLIQPFEQYYHDHIRTHHSPELATPADPDMQFLLALGFRPSMSREALWERLYRTLVSPRFHYFFLRFRLQVNYVSAPLYRRMMVGGSTVAVVTYLACTGTWLPWMVAWVLPLFPCYHVAALLQFVSEHRWLQGHQPHPNKLIRGRLTFGRFVGETLPRRDLPSGPWLRAWGRWLTRLLVLHIPTRLCVLPGDLCQHDWHHRKPRGDWSNACYERQRDHDAGCPGWPEPYEEVWGLDRAIDVVFRGLASLPQTAALAPDQAENEKEDNHVNHY